MADERLRQQYKRLFQELAERQWITPAVETKWIGYLFHITSLENAASILNTGLLCSRTIAIKSGWMRSNNADTSIIETTNDEVKNCARLYFRPRVPTFYHNEGFKSKQELSTSNYDAHCPIPVALVFDASTILAMPGVRFSDGNLASHSARQFASIEEFSNLPFDHIYHNGSIMDTSAKSEIIFHRQAEVIVPQQLPLAPGLVGIYCRSDAEMTTLRHLLAADIAERHERKLKTNKDGSLFEAKRLFVESVTIVDDKAVFVFNPPRNDYSFEARFEAEFELTGAPAVSHVWLLEPRVHRRVAIPIRSPTHDTGAVKLALYLDDHRAYEAMHWLLVEDWITF